MFLLICWTTLALIDMVFPFFDFSTNVTIKIMFSLGLPAPNVKRVSLYMLSAWSLNLLTRSAAMYVFWLPVSIKFLWLTQVHRFHQSCLHDNLPTRWKQWRLFVVCFILLICYVFWQVDFKSSTFRWTFCISIFRFLASLDNLLSISLRLTSASNCYVCFFASTSVFNHSRLNFLVEFFFFLWNVFEYLSLVSAAAVLHFCMHLYIFLLYQTFEWRGAI